MSPIGAPSTLDGADGRPHAAHPVPLLTLAFAFLAVATLLRVPGFSNRVFNSDEAYLATQAQTILDGGRLYVDTVDRKPPVVPYIYAAVFASTGSDHLGAVRVLATWALATTALLLALEARRRFTWRYAGLAAGLLYLLASSALRSLDAQAANFEVFVLPFTTGAMLLAIRGRAVASGLLLAVALLTLQAAAVVFVPIAWLAWRARRVRGLAEVTVASVAPVLLVAIGFGWSPFVRWTLTSNGSYLDWHGDLGDPLRLALSQTGWFLVGSSALVLLLPFAWRHRGDDIELWTWLGVAVAPVVAGLRFFGHYYLELLPPLTLLAVRGLTTPSARTRRWARVAVAVLAVVPAAVFVSIAYSQGNSRDTRIALAVGAYFAAHTAPDQWVLVWGQAPEAYWSSGRRPATRFATTAFLTGATGGRPPAEVGSTDAVAGAWSDFLTDLRRHPPALIADMSTADQRRAAYFPPSRYPRFARYLEQGRWRRVATVDGVAILGVARR